MSNNRTILNNKIVDLSNKLWHISRLTNDVDYDIDERDTILGFLNDVYAKYTAEVDVLRNKVDALDACCCLRSHCCCCNRSADRTLEAPALVNIGAR